MGFSVSGASAVILVGLLVSAATLYPAVDRGAERRTAAVDAREERSLARQNTAVAVAGATHDPGNDTLTVAVENTGATTLSVPAVDLLVDGTYAAPGTAAVDGDVGTDLWAPGETLTLSVAATTAPDRVKVVTGPGVAVTATVEVG